MNPPTFFLLALATAHVAMAGPDLAKEPASVDDKAVTLAASDAAPTVIGGGVKTTGSFTEGNAFLVQPLWDDLGRHGTMGGSILLAEPYFSWGEEGEICASIGLAFRHLFSTQTQADALSRTSAALLDEGFFVGANVFLDYMNTQSDANLWQLGLGVEAGTRYIEVRGNYYIPLGDGDRVGGYDVTTMEPHGRGGQITSLTARTRTIDVIEESMEGWDAELALLVPGLDKWMDVRLIGGYFEFYGDGGGALYSSADVAGWKAGIEVRPVPAVVLSAMWYENEGLVDNHWMYGIRLEIPLGKPDSFTPRRRHLQERLVEPVRRQNAAIAVGVTTARSGPTRVTSIRSAGELAHFLSSHDSNSPAGSIIVLTSTGSGSGGSGLTKSGQGTTTVIATGGATLTMASTSTARYYSTGITINDFGGSASASVLAFGNYGAYKALQIYGGTFNGGITTLTGTTLNYTDVTTVIGTIATFNTSLSKTGAGILIINGSNVYTGTTTINSGTLILNSPTSTDP